MKLAELPHFCWLDSCQIDKDGRWSVLTAAPEEIIQFQPQFEDPAAWLADLNCFSAPPHIWIDDLCLSGVFGYLSYDFGRYLLGVVSQHCPPSALPLAWFGRYHFAIVLDHRQQQGYLLYRADKHLSVSLDCLRQWYQSSAEPSKANFRLTHPLIADLERDRYDHAIAAIHHHLLDGDSYQVNFTQRFSTGYLGEPLIAYRQLRQDNPGPYAAFLRLAGADILSLSPELLLRADGRQVLTKPIKGTIARAVDPIHDRQRQQILQQCPKNRAENVMIVDLLRNDLSKVCETETINVDSFAAIQSLASVHHLVSSVRGNLVHDMGYDRLLAGVFPGGSITGAPKYRTMTLIDQYEANCRGIYCGSIGHIAAGQQCCFNIAIRTLLCVGDRLHCYAGGGIVADSVADQEYQECLDKVSRLLACLARYTGHPNGRN